MAVITVSLGRLRSDFNTAFPLRDKESDGWIGDRAHAEETSGHNPDETGRAEYTDADNIDEVRAVDIDSDLRGARTMQQVIDAILASPECLRRLRYIIFNGWIWSRKNGWKRARYTGPNAHTKHAHFSGDPATDNDASPWLAVLTAGATMELHSRNPQKLYAEDTTVPPPPGLDLSVGEQLGFTFQMAWYARYIGAAIRTTLGLIRTDVGLLRNEVKDLRAEVATLRNAGVDLDLLADKIMERYVERLKRPQ